MIFTDTPKIFIGLPKILINNLFSMYRIIKILAAENNTCLQFSYFFNVFNHLIKESYLTYLNFHYLA